eukprot:gene11901-13867_t
MGLFDCVVALFDLNGDGVIGAGESASIATATGLTHSVAVFGGYLYASSDSKVYRWPYTPGNRTSLGTAQVVVSGIPTGGHQTRTIEFKPNGSFFLSVGSNDNVDPTSIRSRVVLCAFDLTKIPANTGYSYSLCTVFADGCRNEVGLRLAPNGDLWGVENGMDNVARPDLVDKASTDNPCEEVNIFKKEGDFYGYPYCFSEGLLPKATARGSGYQWGVNIAKHFSDTWCNNTANVVKPAYCMTAHVAPLDIIFFNGTTFPSQWNQGVMVAQHGSWNRVPASGYQVVHIAQDQNGLPIPNSLTRIFGSSAAPGTSQKWNTRPIQWLSHTNHHHHHHHHINHITIHYHNYIHNYNTSHHYHNYIHNYNTIHYHNSIHHHHHHSTTHNYNISHHHNSIHNYNISHHYHSPIHYYNISHHLITLNYLNYLNSNTNPNTHQLYWRE